MVDSSRLAFILPSDKKERFATLIKSILRKEVVDIKTLQMFAGKCISFVLAFPASRLFSREVNRAIGVASKSSRPVTVSNDLRE